MILVLLLLIFTDYNLWLIYPVTFNSKCTRIPLLDFLNDSVSLSLN